MGEFVCLQTIGLGEFGFANVTLVRFFAGVYPQMALQFERVRAGIGAVWALGIDSCLI